MSRRRKAVLAALGAAGIIVVAVTAPAASAAPGDATVVPLQITGPPAERLNLIVMGDGYTGAEMQKFRDDVDRNLNVQWSVEPFRSYRNYFNIYRLEIESQDSGIRCDPDDGNNRRNTPLRLNYANGCPPTRSRAGSRTARRCSPAAAARRLRRRARRPALLRHAAAQQVSGDLPGPAGRDRPERADAGHRQHLHLRRHRRHAGDDVGRRPQGPLISTHELGHSLGQLADEYPYSSRDVISPATRAASPARSTTPSGRASRT